MNDLEIKEIVFHITHQSQRFSGKTILITGCCGFLGKIFTHVFLELNKTSLREHCKIIGADNFIVGLPRPDINDANYRFINHDICLPFGTKIHEKIDYIINCSGIADPNVYTQFPLETFAVSSDGTRNILELAFQHKCESVLLFSSSEIYGTPPDEMIPTPELKYSIANFTGERAAYDIGKVIILTLADIYYRRFAVKVKTVLPFNVFSSDMSLKDKRVIPSYINSILNNKAINVFGDGSETRTFCYATDFIYGALLILLDGKNGDYYNLGNPENEISMLDLAYLTENITGKSGLVKKVPYPDVYKIQPQRRCPSIFKMVTQLGFEPKVSLKEGIERCWNWVQSEVNKNTLVSK